MNIPILIADAGSLLTHPVTIGVIVVVLLGIALLLFNFVGIWIRSIAAGASVGMITMIAMRLRGVPVAQIVDARITAIKAGLDLNTDPIEAHYLSGGDVNNCILSLIAAHKAGITLDWNRACAIDLATKGTGKTVLAQEIATALGAPLIEWNIKSTTKAHQGLYEYDAVARLRDSQLGDARVHDIKNYIKKGKLWEAFTAPQLPVLLIDEIDKADIEFPNDLLQELDRMEFFVYETQETIKAVERPIVIITSNNEKELPDAFLRRCFFHYIKFPDRTTMQAIIDVHFPGIQKMLVSKAMDIFYEVRDVPGLKKKPSTSELLDWLKLLLHEDMPLDVLQSRDPTKAIPPLHGALLKNEQDIMLFERLAFMARRPNS